MAVLALAAALAPPPNGILVVGQNLGGVRLGMTLAQVERALGTRYGRCRSCAQTTWYFAYRKFRPEGAAVRFRRGHVDAVWTLWSPLGWRTRDATLAIGMNALEVNSRYGSWDADTQTVVPPEGPTTTTTAGLPDLDTAPTGADTTVPAGTDTTAPATTDTTGG